MDEQKVVSYFKKVCSIPRASGDEKAISDYIVSFAKERGLDVTQDEYYNVIIRKPATVPNAGDAVILQGHLDMVYVKDNGCDHVYENGIEVKEDEKYYYAEGTSLGSDNGIAVAFCLAILDSDSIAHPDLEVIFTVQEETGLSGAETIDISSLKGTRFINLDSEEEGVFYTSCAGGVRSRMIWNIETQRLQQPVVPLQIDFQGLAGGHSGINIGNGLGNAIVLLGRLLYELRDMQVWIGSIDAPGKANAIAKDASIVLYVAPEELKDIKAKISDTEAIFQAELQYTDTISFALTEGKPTKDAEVYTKKYQENIMNALILIPDGVSGYSFAVDDLIETSMNLGALTCEDKTLTLLMSLRSSVESRKQMLRNKLQVIGDSYSDACIFEFDYPGWQYRSESPLRDKAIALYEKMFGKKAEVAAIHAGLECGYWDGKKPGLDIISTGPNLYDVHSTKEKVSKESISHMWQYLQEFRA